MAVLPLTPVYDLQLRVPSPVEMITDQRLSTHGVTLLLKRDDIIHPDFPGNKWRKLLPNLVAARSQGFSTLLTFGGAYSNHILATAAAGHYFGFVTIGVVRGEEHLPLNDVLASAQQFGMQLVYLARAAYRDKNDPTFLSSLQDRFGKCYVLPEGGSNALAVRGCAEVPREITEEFDLIACAVGTGGTLAGIASGLQPGRRAMGIAVLKGGDFLNGDVKALQSSAFARVTANWSIETDFHCGGYAKRTVALDSFTRDFEDRHGVSLNWIYEAKMMFGIYELIAQGKIEPGTTVVAVLA